MLVLKGELKYGKSNAIANFSPNALSLVYRAFQ